MTGINPELPIELQPWDDFSTFIQRYDDALSFNGLDQTKVNASTPEGAVLRETVARFRYALDKDMAANDAESGLAIGNAHSQKHEAILALTGKQPASEDVAADEGEDDVIDLSRVRLIVRLSDEGIHAPTNRATYMLIDQRGKAEQHRITSFQISLRAGEAPSTIATTISLGAANYADSHAQLLEQLARGERHLPTIAGKIPFADRNVEPQYYRTALQMITNLLSFGTGETVRYITDAYTYNTDKRSMGRKEIFGYPLGVLAIRGR